MKRALALCLAVPPLVAWGCNKHSSAGPDPSASASAAIASAEALIASAKAMESALAAQQETPAQKIDKLGYADAFAMAKPEMADQSPGGDVSDGTMLFIYWASKHLRWTDVAVAKDETSFALVRKDSENERGKRICVSGQIVQIEVEKIPSGGKVNVGLLMSNGGNLYHYIAAGSSGELVGESYARLCGVVTGSYDYSNSAGGTGHAVELVGMFDLPENKPKKR